MRSLNGEMGKVEKLAYESQSQEIHILLGIPIPNTVKWGEYIRWSKKTTKNSLIFYTFTYGEFCDHWQIGTGQFTSGLNVRCF